MNLALSKSAGYAIHALTYIARRDGEGPIMARVIASSYNLPYDSILKILRLLAREGHLRTHRGCHGGFTLLVPPENITLLEVVEAIDGPVGKADGSLHGIGDSEVSNHADKLFGAAAIELKRSLAAHTIAELAETSADGKSGAQGAHEELGVD